MGLQSFVRWLLPREDIFFDQLEGLARLGHEATKELARMREPDAVIEEIAAAVQKIEHDADKLVHEIEETLARTFITPIDREDIQALATELDDLVDLTNMAARACVLLGIPQPTEPMKELVGLLVEASGILAESLPALRQHRYADLVTAKRRIRVVEKRGDQVYRDALSLLFKSPDVEAKALLREREVLEDLERALDTAEGVADSLAFLAVKHG